MTALWIAVICLLGAAVGLMAWLAYYRLIRRWAMRLIRERLQPELEERLGGEKPLRAEYGANFFGLESAGKGQLRGNGILVLTPRELYFLQAVTEREVRIPLRDITAVSTARSHLGKWIGRPLLRVDYRAEGGADAAAWAVLDAKGWAEALEAAAASLKQKGGGGDDR